MGKSIENMYADITIKGLMGWWLYLQLLVRNERLFVCLTIESL